MNLMHTLFMFAAQHHLTMTMQHLPGKTNLLADTISHKQFTKFFSLVLQAQQQPTQTPGMLNTF